MGLMFWLFVRPTGVYLLDFLYCGIQYYLLLSPYQGGTSFVDHLCFFCLVFVMPLCTSV